MQKKVLNIQNKETNESKSFINRLLKLIISKAFIKQGLKFAFIGTIGTFVNLSVLYLLTEIFDILYLLSETIAFTVALINNYIFNKVVTFNEKIQERIMKKGIKFALISMIALFVNLLILFVLVEFFDMFYLFAEIFAIFCAFLINFLGNRFWTFKSKVGGNSTKKDMNKLFVEVIMTFWLIGLGILDLTLGFLKKDYIFMLLSLPLISIGIISIIGILIIKFFKNN